MNDIGIRFIVALLGLVCGVWIGCSDWFDKIIKNIAERIYFHNKDLNENNSDKLIVFNYKKEAK